MMNFIRPATVSADQKITEELGMRGMLDNALVAKKEAEKKRNYLGASSLGHPLAAQPWDRDCDRALWFQWKHYPKDKPFPARLYRIFDMGHAAEDNVVLNLRAAGFTVVTHDENGKQYGFELARHPETGVAQYSGHLDGVITAGPATMGGEKAPKLAYPMLWENKAVNDKKWNKFVEEGVERSHPKYYGQILQYQNFFNLYANPAMLTMLNRDTGELAVEFVRFNQRHCQAIIDRAARIIAAKGPLMLERAADAYEKLPCKFCDYASHCKDAEINRTMGNPDSVQSAPSWLRSDKM